MLDDIIANDCQLVWQTGKYFYPKAQAVLSQKENSLIYCSEFIYEMDKAYAVVM